MAGFSHKTPCATKLGFLLSYEPNSGSLTWKVSPRRGYEPGDIAGTVHNGRNKYRIVVIEGRQYYAHRLIYKMMTGQDATGTIDHIDNDGLNNTWANLRPASWSENGCNRRLNKNNKSGVKGVHPKAGLWCAVITFNKTVYRLGRFKTVEEAKAVISTTRTKLHGQFARAA